MPSRDASGYSAVPQSFREVSFTSCIDVTRILSRYCGGVHGMWAEVASMCLNEETFLRDLEATEVPLKRCRLNSRLTAPEIHVQDLVYEKLCVIISASFCSIITNKDVRAEWHYSNMKNAALLATSPPRVISPFLPRNFCMYLRCVASKAAWELRESTQNDSNLRALLELLGCPAHRHSR